MKNSQKLSKKRGSPQQTCRALPWASGVLGHSTAPFLTVFYIYRCHPSVSGCTASSAQLLLYRRKFARGRFGLLTHFITRSYNRAIVSSVLHKPSFLCMIILYELSAPAASRLHLPRGIHGQAPVSLGLTIYLFPPKILPPL